MIDRTELSVLVVEDDYVVAMQVQKCLVDMGFGNVEIAGSLHKAMSMIEQQSFDAAVLDINLRGESVEPVAVALEDRCVPMVIQSGYTGTMILPERFESYPWVSKPFDAAVLRDALDQAITNFGRDSDPTAEATA